MPESITKYNSSPDRVGSIKVRAPSSKVVDALKKLPKIFYLVYAILRIVIQSLQLFWLLLVSERFDYILI